MRRFALPLAALAALGAASMTASADSSDLDGSWWSRLNGGLGITLPIAVPLDLSVVGNVSAGLQVTQLTDGPAAVAAIRLPVGNGTTPTTLTVHLTAATATVQLSACTTVFTWASVRGGVWSARPTCSGPPVPLTLSSDERTGTLDVTRLDQTRIARTGLLEVMLQPTAGALPFTAVLQMPVVADLTGRPAAVGASPTATTRRPNPSISSPTTGVAPPPTAGAEPAQPVIPPVLPSQLPGGSPAPGIDPQIAPQASGPAAAPAPQTAAATTLATHTDRRLLAILVGLLALVTAAAAPLCSRAPALLTSRGAAGAPVPTGTDPADGGLGRHRKPRDGRPPRL